MVSSLAGTTLLVGVDFSEACESALRVAIALAEQSRAQLSLVHVFEYALTGALPSGAPLERVYPAAASLGTTLVTLARGALPRLGLLCSTLVADRVPASLRVLIGDPALALIHAAEQSHASLLVVGELGRRTNQRATLGSTTERLCASSTIPVLVVPLHGHTTALPMLHARTHGA